VAVHEPQDVGLLQVAVFLEELVLLAALAVAGGRLVDGTVASIALAAALPLAAAVVWGLVLAPRAQRRLGHPVRLVAKLALVAAASALLVWGRPAVVGRSLLRRAAALLTAGELSERR
jgi:hypothetical protein